PGVQTCALPICARTTGPAPPDSDRRTADCTVATARSTYAEEGHRDERTRRQPGRSRTQRRTAVRLGDGGHVGPGARRDRAGEGPAQAGREAGSGERRGPVPGRPDPVVLPADAELRAGVRHPHLEQLEPRALLPAVLRGERAGRAASRADRHGLREEGQEGPRPAEGRRLGEGDGGRAAEGQAAPPARPAEGPGPRSHRGCGTLVLMTGSSTPPAQSPSAQPASVVRIDVPGGAVVTHRDVAANGARFHIAEVGDGPLVLLLHGFPQFWWTWRHQMTALADAGFRAVAMDLRGVGGSDRTPRGYDPANLALDITGVVRSLGEPDAALVGHDLGGYLAWTAAAMRPKLVRRLAVASMPHPRRWRSAL